MSKEMRLSNIAFPIAILRADPLKGGRHAYLGKFEDFKGHKASACLNGYYDEAITYDAYGRKFTIQIIELRKPSLLQRFVRRLGHLIVFPDHERNDIASIDMVLEQSEQLALVQLCTEMRDIALAHPRWWKRFATASEICAKFENITSISEVITNIGTLEQKRTKALPGTSLKCIDLR